MICGVLDCGKPIYRRQWCLPHYKQWRKWGDPLFTKRARNNELRQWIDANVGHGGYKCLVWPFSRGKASGRPCTITINGTRISATRYMCLMAHGHAPTLRHEAAHSCGKGHLGCIHPKHLRWATKLENLSDMIIHQTLLVGENKPASKLTNDDVRIILESSMPGSSLARIFGVHHSTIYAIRTGKRWRHLSASRQSSGGTNGTQ